MDRRHFISAMAGLVVAGASWMPACQSSSSQPRADDAPAADAQPEPTPEQYQRDIPAFGQRIVEVEYQRHPEFSPPRSAIKRVEVFEDGVQCSHTVDPVPKSPDLRVYFEPGTAEIRRIEGWDDDCNGREPCVLDHRYRAHGFAWDFEVDDEREAEQLSERRAAEVVEWLADHPDADVQTSTGHGTAMTNDERHATPHQPLGAAVSDGDDNLPRYVRHSGPALSDERLEELIEFREVSTADSSSLYGVPTSFRDFRDLNIIVRFDADWLDEQSLSFEPRWMTPLHDPQLVEWVDEWVDAIVDEDCNPAALDDVDLPTRSDGASGESL